MYITKNHIKNNSNLLVAFW